MSRKLWIAAAIIANLVMGLMGLFVLGFVILCFTSTAILITGKGAL